jgi:hypothetical protein
MRNKKWLKIGLVMTLVLALGVTAVSAAWPGRGGDVPPGIPAMPGMRAGDPMLTVVAEQLDMEVADLVTELQAGKTIAQLAEEKGVATDAIVEAFVAAHAEQLAQAVEAGYLTQAQADAHLALLKADAEALLNRSFEGIPGFGMGRGGFGMMGPGGMRGRGGFGPGGWWGQNPSAPDVTPEETPEANT